MTLLEKTRGLISSFDSNEFYRNAAIFIGINVFLMLGIMWFYYSRTTSLQGSLKEIYKKEYEANGLLDRLKEVKKRSEAVNTLLEQDKTFKIKNFFDDTIKKLNLSTNQRGEAKVSEETVLKKRYTEVTIQAQLQRINTKQLCELLQAIEQKARIYTKELTIVKMKGATLAVTLTIATLTAQTDKKK